ncbi:hypothetical protein PCASD_18035 [Puccinia coronata f. sp. avenae]|uniref:Uncharacterized protein n=1 Tax=Puccinia coronata f. sp. avenae TaxID=200324 RepID=A0A2N5SM82_9BASI|nr:hypothetical protein PCASD_18035 [Puccinia coronata f. sp. avenae]
MKATFPGICMFMIKLADQCKEVYNFEHFGNGFDFYTTNLNAENSLQFLGEASNSACSCPAPLSAMTLSPPLHTPTTNQPISNRYRELEELNHIIEDDHARRPFTNFDDHGSRQTVPAILPPISSQENYLT